MARRKSKKKKTSLIGPIVLEGLAIVVFVALFLQARAERQGEAIGETPVGAVAAWPSMLEQTPFHEVAGSVNNIDQQSNGSSNNVIFNAQSFLNRFGNID